MQKSLLEKFINKYHLGGATEQVLIESLPFNKLQVNFVTGDQHLAGKVTAIISDGFPEGEYPIFNSSKLSSMLGLLDINPIPSVVTRTRDDIVTPVIIEFEEGTTKVSFPLANRKNMPEILDSVELPTDYALRFKVDADFINKFSRAVGILSDIASFSIISKKTGVFIVVGAPASNTNKITLQITPLSSVNEFSTIKFFAKYVRDILVANKELSGIVTLYTEGILKLEFADDTFASEYYLTEMTGPN